MRKRAPSFNWRKTTALNTPKIRVKRAFISFRKSLSTSAKFLDRSKSRNSEMDKLWGWWESHWLILDINSFCFSPSRNRRHIGRTKALGIFSVDIDILSLSMDPDMQNAMRDSRYEMTWTLVVSSKMVGFEICFKTRSLSSIFHKPHTIEYSHEQMLSEVWTQQ
jgi:hypothetical protein